MEPALFLCRPLHFLQSFFHRFSSSPLSPLQKTLRSRTWRGDGQRNRRGSGSSWLESMGASAEAPIAVLFVCLGNICRSPTAEAVFINAVKKRGLESQFKIDSAGTINYHEESSHMVKEEIDLGVKGDPADSRMRAAALRRGVKLESISRPVRPSDFNNFDYILAMDKKNRDDLFRLHKSWRTQTKLPDMTPEKVQLMCDYCTSHRVKEVPDPYYGGPQGFEETAKVVDLLEWKTLIEGSGTELSTIPEKVLDLLEDACEGFLESIVTKE